jgi:hypothetical protein
VARKKRASSYKRNRPQKRNRAGPPPDEYFAAGPLEIARFGKLTVGRSRATPEQWEHVRVRMARDLPKIITEIDALVDSIADTVTRLPPDRLLQRAWWELARIVTDASKTDTDELELLTAMRMLDYVQSVIASVEPQSSYSDEIAEEDWTKLKQDVGDLFSRLSLEYQMSLTAHKLMQDAELDMELEQFRFQAETLWMNVRGERYQPHERQALLDVLSPHSEILVRLFGIDAQTLVIELDKILAKLTSGLHDAFLDLKQLQEDTIERLPDLAAETGTADLTTLRDKLRQDPNIAERGEKLRGEIFGFDLFDVEKITNLPKLLLDELTWCPGEETSFFAPGEFCGWPLRVWPTMMRPFIRLDGRVLCFDMYALFDNFYRVLQRLIFRLTPDYKVTWNDRQKAITEDLPFIYLTRLLPGAQVFRPVYYRWRVGAGPAQWYEADGLVIYDDHLFVIEVKGGASTYTSPATDLSAHIESLRNLVLSPASQGSRFVDYLESASEVTVSDANHVEITRLRRSEFRHVTVCAVTLDDFTHLAARAQHLRNIGIDVGHRKVWVLSIDSLRVYADLFDNPLKFLHFTEQRMSAARSELVDLNDEMDHFGLYITENNYGLYAAELTGSEPTRLTFDGYRTPVDDYYGALARGEQPETPKQQVPERIAEIIGILTTSGKSGRSAIASFLLDAAGDLRETIANSVDQQPRDNVSLGRARPISIYGDFALTLWVWSPSAPRNPELVIATL